MGLFNTIQTINSDNLERVPSNIRGTVKSYYNGTVTVETDDGTLESIQCIGSPVIGKPCLLVVVDDEYVCVPNPDTYSKEELEGIIEDIISGDIDLSKYYTKTEVDSKFVTTTDSRLSDARTPTSHSHGNLTNGGTLNSDSATVNKVAVTDSSNNLKTISQLPYSKISGTPTIPSKTSDLTNDGDGTNVFVKNNDSRLSDARTPTSHTHDDRYYTENEIDTALSGKSNTGHTHSYNELTSIPSTFPPETHNHDDRYYTESEVDTALSGKSNNGHTHTKSNIIDFEHSHIPTEVSDDASDYPNIYQYSLPGTPSTVKSTLRAIDIALGAIVKIAPFEVVSSLPTASDDTMGKLYFLLSNNKVDVYYTERSGTWQSYSYSWQELDLNIAWSDIQSKPSDFPPSSHTHDDRYYTESEVDTALNAKQDNLVSGTNIRTVNGNDLLGSGDIVIGSTGTIDDTVTQNSSNPVKSSGIYSALESKLEESDLLDLVYPVGAIYMSVNSTNPSILFGGTWEHINDCFLLASHNGQGLGQTGGEASHTLTVDEMPSHTHIQDEHNHTQNAHHHTFPHYQNNGSTTTYSASWGNQKTANANTSDTTATNKPATATNRNTGGGQAHNNMPPYLIVNVWKRTA